MVQHAGTYDTETSGPVRAFLSVWHLACVVSEFTRHNVDLDLKIEWSPLNRSGANDTAIQSRQHDTRAGPSHGDRGNKGDARSQYTPR